MKKGLGFQTLNPASVQIFRQCAWSLQQQRYLNPSLLQCDSNKGLATEQCIGMQSYHMDCKQHFIPFKAASPLAACAASQQELLSLCCSSRSCANFFLRRLLTVASALTAWVVSQKLLNLQKIPEPTS